MRLVGETQVITEYYIYANGRIHLTPTRVTPPAGARSRLTRQQAQIRHNLLLELINIQRLQDVLSREPTLLLFPVMGHFDTI